MNYKERKLTAAPTIKPQADWRFTSTYSRPQTTEVGRPDFSKAGEQWGRLASALEKFAPEVADYLNTSEVDEAMDASKAGEAYVQTKVTRDQMQLQWAELVRQHPELEAQNPYFRIGARKSYLKARSGEYKAFLVDEWNRDAIKNMDDPAAVSQWMTDKRQAWMKDHIGGGFDDVELFDGFLPGMTEAEKTVQAMHSDFRMKEVSKVRREQFFNSIFQNVSGNFSVSAWNDPTMIPQKQKEFATLLKQEMDAAYAEGLSGSEVNQMAVQAAVQLAQHFKDSDILDALDMVITDEKSGSVLGKTAFARDAMDKVKLEMEDLEYKRWSRNKEKITWSRGEADRMSWEQGRNIIIENADNPDWDYNSLVEQLTKQNPRISAGTLSSLESFHNKMQGNSLELRKDDKFLVKWTHAMNTDQSFTEGAYEADLYNAFMNDRISKDEYFSGRSVLKQFAEGKMYRMDSLYEKASSQLKFLLTPKSGINEATGLPEPGIQTEEDKAKLKMASDLLYNGLAQLTVKYSTTEGLSIRDPEYASEAMKLVNDIAADPRFAPNPEITRANRSELIDKPVEQRDKLYLTPEHVLRTPPEQIDFNKSLFWGTPEEFSAASTQFDNAVDPEATVVGRIARHIGVDPVALLKAQAQKLGGVYLTAQEQAELRQAANERARQAAIDAARQQQANAKFDSAKKIIEDKRERDRSYDMLRGATQDMLNQIKSPEDIKEMVEDASSLFE